MFKVAPQNHREVKSNNSEINFYVEVKTIMVLDQKDSIKKLAENFECIHKWLKCNRLGVNMEKTEFVEFGIKKSKPRSIFIDGHPIESVDDMK